MPTIRKPFVALAAIAGLSACAFFQQPLDLRVVNDSAEESVVTLRAEGIPDDRYVVAPHDSQSIAGDRPESWSVWVGESEATSWQEWPNDNPSIELTIYVRADGSVEVVDDR